MSRYALGLATPQADNTGSAWIAPTAQVIGDDTMVGHRVILHGCAIGASCLIGIRAVIMNGAVIGAQSIVTANTLITESKKFSP